MAERNTKRRILDAALHLINKNGLANVRLLHIANEINISVGNLAYHYKNKEAMVGALAEDIFEEAKEILSQYRQFPNFIDFDIQLSKYYKLLQTYPFYFFDVLELYRHYPRIFEKRQEHISKMNNQIRKRLDFNLKRGMIIAEPRPGVYDSVANTIWVSMTFWFSQNAVRSEQQEQSEIEFKKMVWNQLYVYLTKAGVDEFNQLIEPMLQPRSFDH